MTTEPNKRSGEREAWKGDETERQFAHLDPSKADPWDGILGNKMSRLDEFNNAETVAESLGKKLASASYFAPSPTDTPIAPGLSGDARLGALVRKLATELADSPKSFLANVQRAISDLDAEARERAAAG